MYDSEAEFGSALLTSLRAKTKRLFIQRIESGETARGIPDLYIRSVKREYWIELKNVKRASVYDASWQIPWRPGQIAWAHQYNRCSALASYTIVALRDGFLIVSMVPYQKFKRRMVYPAQCARTTLLSDVVKCIQEGLEHYVC